MKVPFENVNSRAVIDPLPNVYKVTYEGLQLSGGDVGHG